MSRTLSPGWVDKEACGLCAHGDARLFRSRAVPWLVCSDCFPRLARFVLESPRTVVARFWAIPREGEALRRGGLPLELPQDEVQAHADLAVAYREMQLAEDAIVEAATALCNRPGAEAARQAIDVLLGPRLQREIDSPWLNALKAALFPV
jgi:hypothetical protein